MKGRELTVSEVSIDPEKSGRNLGKARRRRIMSTARQTLDVQSPRVDGQMEGAH